MDNRTHVLFSGHPAAEPLLLRAVAVARGRSRGTSHATVPNASVGIPYPTPCDTPGPHTLHSSYTPRRYDQQFHSHLKLIVVEDGLASNAPHIRELLDLDMHFILGETGRPSLLVLASAHRVRDRPRDDDLLDRGREFSMRSTSSTACR